MIQEAKNIYQHAKFASGQIIFIMINNGVKTKNKEIKFIPRA